MAVRRVPFASDVGQDLVEAPVKTPKQRTLPDLSTIDLSGKAVCEILDLTDENGSLKFYIVKEGQRQTRVFPVDVSRFKTLLELIGEPFLNEGWLVPNDQIFVTQQATASGKSLKPKNDCHLLKNFIRTLKEKTKNNSDS